MSGVARESGDRPLGGAGPGPCARHRGRAASAFRDAYVVLENRIKLLVALPIEKLDRMMIKRHVDEIGSRGLVSNIIASKLGP